jgi:hypothetical protein
MKKRLLKVKVIVYMETTEETIDQTFIGSSSLTNATKFFNENMERLAPPPVPTPFLHRVTNLFSKLIPIRKRKSLSY